MDCAERRRQYALAVEAEALRREILRAQLYQDAMLDRRDDLRRAVSAANRIAA